MITAIGTMLSLGPVCPGCMKLMQETAAKADNHHIALHEAALRGKWVVVRWLISLGKVYMMQTAFHLGSREGPC